MKSLISVALCYGAIITWGGSVRTFVSTWQFTRVKTNAKHLCFGHRAALSYSLGEKNVNWHFKVTVNIQWIISMRTCSSARGLLLIAGMSASLSWNEKSFYDTATFVFQVVLSSLYLLLSPCSWLWRPLLISWPRLFLLSISLRVSLFGSAMLVNVCQLSYSQSFSRVIDFQAFFSSESIFCLCICVLIESFFVDIFEIQ